MAMTTASTSGGSKPPQGTPHGPAEGEYTPSTATAARALPQSIEAEACVLGSMILDAATVDVVVHILGGDDFFRPAHRLIFQQLVRMHDAGKPIDLTTLPEELAREKLLEKVGGVEYLVRIVEGVPSTASVEYYAHVVRDKAMLRGLISATGQIAQNAYDSQEEPSQIIDQAEHAIFEIASRQIGDHAETLEALIEQTFERLESHDGSMITGVATGYYKFDELTSGLQNGEMIVLAARPSMGKTALALNMAEYMAVDDGRPVLLFSLEMSKGQIAQRFLCSRARYDSSRLRRGSISPEDWTQLHMAADELTKSKIFVDDTADLNVVQLRSKARRLRVSDDIACVFVDYLQLMNSVGRVESRQQQISEISRGLKALARELEIPVVVLSQLNRGPEGRETHRPRMSDLRESGAIEQDADVVGLLHREDYYHRGEPEYAPTGITELILVKQRYGPVDTVPLTFLPACVRFENCATEEAPGF
jgi:replicative DNA helicase